MTAVWGIPSLTARCAKTWSAPAASEEYAAVTGDSSRRTSLISEATHSQRIPGLVWWPETPTLILGSLVEHSADLAVEHGRRCDPGYLSRRCRFARQIG